MILTPNNNKLQFNIHLLSTRFSLHCPVFRQKKKKIMKILCWIEIGLQSPEYFCFFFLCFHILLTCENVFEQNKGLVFVLMSIAFFCD